MYYPKQFSQEIKRFSLLAYAILWLALIFTVAIGWLPVQAQPFAYVTNGFSNNVSVINTASNSVVATVTVGSVPYGVAITPDGSFAYVANQGSDNVSVINTASNSVVAHGYGG